jgi:hypothetical protein
MSFVRNIAADLVDKRLWPLAAILVIALVAVPVVLSNPASESGGTAPLSAAGQGPVPGLPAVNSTPGGGPIGGSPRNPFRQQHLPRPLVSNPSGIGPATAGSASAASGGDTSGGGSSGASGGSTPGGGSTTPSQQVTKLRVKFGPSDGSRPTRDITDGTPLPSASNPLLVYVGLKSDGKTALFLVSSDAQPQGDGVCRPNRAICSELELKPGQTEFFDVTGPGGTVQYELDVVRVVKG